MRLLLAALVAFALVLAAGCGGEDEGEETTPLTTVPTPTETETAPAETDRGGGADGGCEQADQPEAREEGGERKPRKKLEDDVSYEAVVSTNCGDFTIEIDAEGAPNLAASFVSLSRKGFYEGTVFHRIVPGFVIQGGDPTGTGTGGPGYKTVDEPAAGTRYTRGVVAMAKTQTEAPGTAGSQFFVVTGQDVGLPPEYAVLGKVTDGLDVIDEIGKLGDPATEQPTQAVVVERIEVRER